MKKFLLMALCCNLLMLNAQEAKVWTDSYINPDAIGYEDLQKASYYYNIGDMSNYWDYLRNAASQGNLNAWYKCACLTMAGIKGVLECDTAKAVEGMFYAAQKGYAPAQWAMARYYHEGLQVQQNYNSAAEMLKLSADQGYLPSKAYLANCYLLGQLGIARDEEKGLIMTEECANAGNIDSQRILGCFYSGGTGNVPDYTKAIKWLTLAASGGDWQASNNLALMNARGQGTEVNFPKAHTLIQDARFRAQTSGQLTKDVEANLLDSDGEIYMMEGKTEEANAIWRQMKGNHPEYVEDNKYNPGNVFVRTMYKQEQEASRPSLSANNITSQNPVIVSDIDEKIPENPVVGNPTFAVIIANENYNEVEEVPYAIRDGETFKKYCEKTLGIPQSNIKFVADATLNNIKRQVNWITQIMDVYEGEVNIVLYYAGHGIPNESNGSAYLLPVDGVGNDVTTGYSLDKLYADLSSKPAKSVVVLLDACFSGAKRDGGMLASARGVAIKAKQNAPKGNMVVLSAAQGDETAYPYKEKGHGMFTYYLLKKLQETKGDVTFGELADYVTAEVKKQSIVVNGKMQTPLAKPSSNATDWRNWKLR